MGILRPTKKRPPCPFYGFAKDGNFLMDMGKNICGLVMPVFTPCEMEGAGLKPDLSFCQNRKLGEDQLKDMLWDYVVFPQELQPEEGGLTGIPLGIWADMVKSKMIECNSAPP